MCRCVRHHQFVPFRKLARGRSNLKSVVYTFQSDAIDDQFSRRRPRGQTKRGEDDGPTGSDPKVACSSARGPLPIWLLFVDSHSRRRSCHLTIHFIFCDSDPLINSMSLPRRTSNLPLSLHLYSAWDNTITSGISNDGHGFIRCLCFLLKLVR